MLISQILSPKGSRNPGLANGWPAHSACLMVPAHTHWLPGQATGLQADWQPEHRRSVTEAGPDLTKQIISPSDVLGAGA